LQNPTFSYTEPVCYQAVLTVSNVHGCTDVATEEICIQPEVTIYVPNAFTPNGDGLNDVFLPKGSGLDWNTFSMMIFDRWGNLIYETTDINKGWRGIVKNSGEIAQQDIYVWKIDINDLNGAEHHHVGDVMLAR
jgi:gliding motility-associated-like protein